MIVFHAAGSTKFVFHEHGIALLFFYCIALLHKADMDFLMKLFSFGIIHFAGTWSKLYRINAMS